jgi:hypothetical protein
VKRALLLGALVACGDNRSVPAFTLDAGFDDLGHTRYFGQVSGLGPPPKYMMTPQAGALVCIAGNCDNTRDDSSFVLVGPNDDTLLDITTAGYVPYHEPVHGGIAGDRNLASILLLEPSTLDQLAAAFGETVTAGTVLVEAGRYDAGTVTLAIDGYAVHYLDANQAPAPTLTALSSGGGAIVLGVAPGEIRLHVTAGHCVPDLSGWPGAQPDEIRLDAVAGTVTVVRPLCHGD